MINCKHDTFSVKNMVILLQFLVTIKNLLTIGDAYSIHRNRVRHEVTRLDLMSFHETSVSLDISQTCISGYLVVILAFNF